MFSSASFFRTHLLLIPITLGLMGELSHFSGFDHALEMIFYDTASNSFPAHASAALEMFGHHFAKTAVSMVWLALLVCVLSTYAWPRWRPNWTARRPALWSAFVGMAMGPLIVSALKGMNSYHCPWDLVDFGGGAEFTSSWFVPAAEVGHCFPGGHASSGFCLAALYFLARETDNPRLMRVMLMTTLAVGISFSLIRMVQGAHFLSHNLWSAAICWAAAALAFVPLYVQRQRALVAA
ncbi:MAG TPA: phosphatase PAP2 family protein [Rhodocyclaceae bacterium]|jgi:membrane-associated PAP2 superfamily phosphatase|nr:phosphatase PAP2 family protein [Rhodocyclaceae bacterium]